MNDGAPLSFSVTYRLQEYLAIIRSHALARATPQGASGFQLFTTRVLVAVVGRIMFAVKSRRVGTCDFTVSETGIIRRSRQGETVVPWSKVTALHAYDAGYIIEVGAGGMPGPFRGATSIVAFPGGHVRESRESRLSTDGVGTV